MADEVNIFNIYQAQDEPPLSYNSMVSDVSTSNELSYQASPTRANNMTLHNDEEAFYVPTVKFTLAYMTPESFATFMQIVNSKGFIVQYFDYELGEVVYRAMYVTEKSLERLHTDANAILLGVVHPTITMVSVYGYPYTKASDPNFNEDNKYHYYQLHLHITQDNISPDGTEVLPYA